MKLTSEQRAAAHHDGHLCLTSCPGSGKTRTIVAKALRCIEDVRGTPRRVACITYTNAAVDELDARLSALCDGDSALHCEVSTIHTLCLTNVLYPYHFLLPEFSDSIDILTPDDDEWGPLVRELLGRHGVVAKHADKFEGIQRDPDGVPTFPPDLTHDIAQEFCDYMDERGLTTLGDIVYHTLRVINQHVHILECLATRFAWMLVDEFQDTTTGQVELLTAIHAQERTTFFLVGDTNQSIMEFAGANPYLMGEFAESIEARTDIRLRGNFRCSQVIVDHAELLCPTTPPMEATGPNADVGIEPIYAHVQNSVNAVFEHFLPMVDSLGIQLGDAAVLAPWWITLLPLGRELRARNVPIIGPGARPYRRSREFAQLAEHLGAMVIEPDAELFRKTQRALFRLVFTLTLKTQWRLFSYDGSRVLCRILNAAERLYGDGGGAVEWLQRTAQVTSEILSEEGFIYSEDKQMICNSVVAMVADMRHRNIDPINMSVSDLGVFARPRDCLQLMTLHASKGREFEAVALIDLHDGRLPHFTWETKEQYDESRRVLYVGITRAKKLLMYFTDSGDRRNRPSPFLGHDGLRLSNQ